MANNEIGAPGLMHFGGLIQSDFLRELRGLEGYKRYREMQLNSPIIGGLVLAIRQPVLAMAWTFSSLQGDTDPRLKILNDSVVNMSYGLKDHISEALAFLIFGYYPFEIVYERVNGAMLWRKFSPRGQDTIIRWDIGDDGGISGIYQRKNYVEEVYIPIEKMILYRINVERNNPEGRSLLRTSWTSYYYAKYMMQAEAIGIERGLDGFPSITLPEGANTDTNDINSDASKAAEFVRNIRNDEQAGIVLPFGWTLDLFAPGSQSRLDADKVIRRYESRMLMSALAQFLNLGQETRGSQALSTDQTDFFSMSVNATADVISDTVTKFAIPRLMKLNGYDAEGLSLTHSPATQEDVTKISTFLQQTGSYLNWTAEDEVWLRGLARLPERDVTDIQAEMDTRTAARDAMVERLKQSQNNPKDGNQPIDQKSNMSAWFTARAPDEKQRMKQEKEFQKKLNSFFDKQKSRILKQAKQTRQS